MKNMSVFLNMEENLERKGSRKSIKNLSESVRSLLGFKTYLTPSWVDSVCNIIKEMPTEKSVSSPYSQEDSSDLKDVGGDIPKIEDDIAFLNSQLNQLNLQRKKALNDFLDLKGNIRVFCRIRPILQGEKCRLSSPVVALDSSNLMLKFSEDKSKHYSFDKVFHPGSSQDEVFSEVEPIIKSALDGYNACIFAYGQTGTGKTFTMEGKPDCPGVIPRTIEALFQQAHGTNHKLIFTFSMLEIYIGSIRDLLVPQTTKGANPSARCLPIKLDPNGGVEIDNLLAIRVNDCKQAKKLYRLGCRFRSTASTNSNRTSSRSHCLIRLSVTCHDAREWRKTTNKLWMVDLGGSERLLKTKARGKRLDEGKAINLSLSALGDVINALQRKKSHVPYRNSKLTQILRDSLGEDSKTIMLVHVSPKEDDLCETVCSLGFASRVRSVHLGCEESSEVKADKKVAMSLLLNKIKNLECACENVRNDVMKLMEKLKHLNVTHPLLDEPLEDPNLTLDKMQSREVRKKQNVRNVLGVISSRLPRFMRPTISSQQRTGVECLSADVLSKKDPILRRKKASSVRAESVTFPLSNRSHSECGSDVLDLTWKYSEGYGSECNYDASEFVIKKAVIPESEKSFWPSDCSTSAPNHDNINDEPEKHLMVESWLHLQKDESSKTYLYGSRQVAAVHLLEGDLKDDNERHETRISENVFEEKDHYMTEDLASGNANGNSPVPCFMNEFEMNADSYDQLSNQKIHSRNMIPNVMHMNGSEEQSDEKNYAESYGAEKVGQKNVIGLVMPIDLETRENIEDGDLSASQQPVEDIVKPSLLVMRSRRALFVAKDFSETETGCNNSGVLGNLSKSSKLNEHAGICRVIGEKVQTAYFVALLGLGFDSIGLGHDFFHGLTL